MIIPGRVCIQLDYPNYSLELWHPVIHKYRGAGYKAHMFTDSKGQRFLAIISTNLYELKATIPWNKIYVIHAGNYTVSQSGWLLYIYQQERPAYLKAFEQVSRGERPGFLDNDPFIRINMKYAGKIVRVLHFCFPLMIYPFKVYNTAGEKIWHQTHFPLAFKRWAPGHEAAEHSHLNIKEYQNWLNH
jgi:hypothetical protein